MLMNAAASGAVGAGRQVGRGEELCAATQLGGKSVRVTGSNLLLWGDAFILFIYLF